MQVIRRHRATMLLRRAVARRGRQIVAGLLLGCYLFVLLGIPAAGPAILSLRGGPYPCQDGACGCQSADQCWRSCCCYSDRQKLAWAEANGVTPPRDFLRRVARLGLTAPRPALPRPVANGDHRTAACCQTAKPPQQAVAACCRAAHSEAPESASAATGLVLAIEALKCRGLAGDWTGLPVFAPLSAPKGWPLERLMTQLPVAAAPATLDLSFPPPSPPPRV